ncbi:hypothetical protein [Polynucleobacter sp. AM-7D1]|uniref:hypothetical protein n=1 Tax=Polynucleobacter sp. AM-7D1 TaxID=2689102 RepID=UPI001BFEC6DA|nr:hypothetical protein [Polynucleobacter sp. AM-7D1]QWE28471.1 hypothetical protein GQ359_08715 [Polynucleobacter sp. AM-7D1]
MPKKAGGQPKTSYEKARIQIWYEEIKSRGNPKDGRLDKLFVWRSPHLKGDVQPKIFANIRKYHRYPKGLDPRWRDINEIVLAVESDPQYQGTSDLFNAELWDLLETKSITEAQIYERIDRVLIQNDLERRPGKDIPGYRQAIMITRFSSSFNETFEWSMEGISALTRGYLELLHGMHMKTMQYPLPMDAFPVKSHFLEEYLILRLGDFGKECYVDLIKKVDDIEVLKNQKEGNSPFQRRWAITWPFCKAGQIPVLGSYYGGKSHPLKSSRVS